MGWKNEKFDIQESHLQKAAKYFKFEFSQDLLSHIGMGIIPTTAVIEFIKSLEKV